MRILGLVLVLCFIATNAFADVTAEILDVTQDTNNGSIIVRTQYKIDGVEVPSRYPKLDGKYYWQTRYNLNQFAGMTNAEAKTFIFKDIQSFCKSLIKKTYLKLNNYQYVQDKANLLIGQTGQVDSAEILVDTNADGIYDTKWIIKTDGTRTEEPYTP